MHKFILCLKNAYFEALNRKHFLDCDFLDSLLLEYLQPKDYEKWNNKEKRRVKNV